MAEQNGKTKYDWEKLKGEFFASDFLEIAPFIRQRLGKDTANDNNIATQTKGWAEEKREKKRKQVEEVENQVKQELIEKLKIQVEELLAAKKLSFVLLSRYLECFGKQVEGKDLTKAEKEFVKEFPIDIDKSIKWIQIELGLPTNIAQLQGSKEKPLVITDAIRRVKKAIEDANRQ